MPAVDAARCARILRCVADTGGELRVAFNYRYAPVAARVRELLRAGEVGTVASVHFEWLLNTSQAPTTSAAGTASNATRAGCWCTSRRTTSAWSLLAGDQAADRVRARRAKVLRQGERRGSGG